jgi:hypothetical protein
MITLNRNRRRITLQRKQRSAGRHLFGPVYASFEHHSHPKYTPVKYINLTVGNPRKHYDWAFSIWVHYHY